MRRVSLGVLAYAVALSLVVALTPTSAVGAYKTCSPNFPHGVKGTIRTVVIVGYQYKTEGDMEITSNDALSGCDRHCWSGRRPIQPGSSCVCRHPAKPGTCRS